MQNSLVVFDLDYTLINNDSSTLWCKYLNDKGIADDPLFLQKEEALMQQYEKGTMDVHDYIRFSMQPLLNISKSDIETMVADYVKTSISDKVFHNAKQQIAMYKAMGVKMIIISASASFIVKEVAKLLGIDDVIGVDVKENQGFYTNEIDGRPPFKEGKVTKLEEYLKASGEKVDKIIFYSDSINDLALLRRADEAYVVNPSDKLLKIAKESNFNILRWQ